MASFSDFVNPDMFKKLGIKNDFPKKSSPDKKQTPKTIFSSARSNPRKNNNPIPKEKATAPYNFISLPERILLSPMDKDRDLLLHKDDKIAR